MLPALFSAEKVQERMANVHNNRVSSLTFLVRYLSKSHYGAQILGGGLQPQSPMGSTAYVISAKLNSHAGPFSHTSPYSMCAAGKGLIEESEKIKGESENVLCGDACMPNRYFSLFAGMHITETSFSSTSTECTQMPRCQDVTISVF